MLEADRVAREQREWDKLHPPKPVHEQVVWEHARSGALRRNDPLQYQDEKNNTPYAPLIGAVTPGPDAVIQIGEYIASDWTVEAWQYADSFDDLPAKWTSEQQGGHVKRRRWSRNVQTGDDDVEGNPVDDFVELAEWEGADPELVALKKQALLDGKSAIQLAQDTSNVLNKQNEQLQGFTEMLVAMNARGGVFDFAENRLKDLERQEYRKWTMGLAPEWQSFEDYASSVRTQFEICKASDRPFGVPPQKDGSGNHLKTPKVEFRMTIPGKLFGTQEAEFYLQCNKTCLYLIKLTSGLGGGSDAQLHTIIEYRHIEVIMVNRDGKTIIIQPKQFVYQKFDGAKEMILEVKPHNIDKEPYQRGAIAAVRDIVTLADIAEIAIKVEYQDSCTLQFNTLIPKRAKKLLAKARTEKSSKNDSFLDCIQKELKTIQKENEKIAQQFIEGEIQIKQNKEALAISNKRMEGINVAAEAELNGSTGGAEFDNANLQSQMAGVAMRSAAGGGVAGAVIGVLT